MDFDPVIKVTQGNSALKQPHRSYAQGSREFPSITLATHNLRKIGRQSRPYLLGLILRGIFFWLFGRICGCST